MTTFAFTSYSASISRSVPTISTPMLISAAPRDKTTGIGAKRVAVRIGCSGGVFFTASGLDRVGFANNRLVDTSMLNTDGVLAMGIGIPKERATYSLSVPRKVMAKPGRVPTPTMSIRFSAITLSGTLITTDSTGTIGLCGCLLSGFRAGALSTVVTGIT